jgi:hypothetical protein
MWLEARCGGEYPAGASGCDDLKGFVVARTEVANEIALGVIRFVHFRRSFSRRLRIDGRTRNLSARLVPTAASGFSF